MSTGDIEAHIQDIYGISFSDSMVSRIMDKIYPLPKSGSSGRWNPFTLWYFWMPSTIMSAAGDRL